MMFNSCVMYPSLILEGQAEYVVLIRAVTNQERALWFLCKLVLCLLPAQRSPVPTTLKKL